MNIFIKLLNTNQRSFLMKAAAPIIMMTLVLFIGNRFANAQSGFVTTPEKGKPDTWIAMNVGSLRAMFPSWKSMAADTLASSKPKPFDRTSLEAQPLRVMKNDDKDKSVILLGADEYGETKLHMLSEQGEDGKLSFSSAAGVPGTIWVLPRDVWINAGDLKVKGFKIRVLKKAYDWKNPQSGKIETVPDVIHVEFENLASKAQGELVYVLQGNKEAKFILSQKVGVFVFDFSDNPARLVDRLGWKKMN